MFSSNDEKTQKLVNLRGEYVQRIEKNVEKLTKQLKFLNTINEQIGGKAGTKAGTTDDKIDLIQIQIDQALNEAQLGKAVSELGGETADKLKELKKIITDVLGDDKTGEQVKLILSALKEMTIPEVSSIPQKEMTTLKKAAKDFATSNGDAKALKAWEKAQEVAKAAAAKAVSSKGSSKKETPKKKTR